MVTKTFDQSRCYVEVYKEKEEQGEDVVQLDIKHFHAWGACKQTLDLQRLMQNGTWKIKIYKLREINPKFLKLNSPKIRVLSYSSLVSFFFLALRKSRRGPCDWHFIR